jgi:lysophospholipase L1-like esterase
VIRNYKGITPDNVDLVPELWTRYGSQDDDGSYTFPESDIPDAVVICLGTNDFGYLGTRDPLDINKFTSAYLAFVNNVSQHYPGAQIFLVSSLMLSDTNPTPEDAQHTTLNNVLKNLVESFGAGAHFVDWPTYQGVPGCDNHPNAKMHSDQSKILAAAIGSALGWA